MASPSSNGLPIPRLRLSRRSESLQTPGAGPSSTRRWPDSASDTHSPNNAIEGHSSNGGLEDDEYPTPKPATAYLDSAETPAARLRAVLSRIPDPNKTPVAGLNKPLPPEQESQYDMGSIEANSFAQKSVKDIFTRALREPGSTPRKAGPGRLRRNSVDVSEVENSPMVQHEREKIKGKKKSMSDEELEAAKSAQRSEASYKSSSASTFDILRERLNNSHTQIKDQHLPNSLFAHEVSDTDSVHGGYILGNSADISTTPAMSSFRESFRMNMTSKSQSNLLGDDTTMQRAMDEFPPSDAESDKQSQGSASAPPVPFPVNRGKKSLPDGLTHGRPQQRPRSLSAAKRLAGLLHAESSLHHSTSHAGDSSQLHDLERKWNKPVTPHRPDTPDHHHHHSTQSSTNRLRRHSSNLSLSSASTSSVVSNGEATVKQKSRLLEREHSWNKPQSRLTRPTSSLSLRSPELAGSRSRKSSISSLTDVGRRTFGRTDSFSSSRASSPAYSANGLSYDGRSEPEVVEALHERERNWNANRPKWEHQEKLRSPPHESIRPESPSTIRPAPRVRAESLQSAVAKKMNASLGHISPQPSPTQNGNGHHLRSPPNSASPSRIPKPSPGRPHSFYGSPSTSRQPHKSPSISPTAAFRLSGIPRSRTNSSSTSSQSQSNSTSYHPRTSPQPPKPSLAALRRNQQEIPPANDTDVETDTEPDINLNMQNGQIPHLQVTEVEHSQDEHLPEESSEEHDEVSQHLLSEDEMGEDYPESDFIQEEEEVMDASPLPPVVEDHVEEDLLDDIQQDNTPTIRGKLQLSPPASPAPVERQVVDQSAPDVFVSMEESSPEMEEPSPIPPPPESPSRADTSFQSVLATPPRRASFSSSKVDFHIPTPPRHLPDLPDPPSSSEDGFNESSRLKTPDTTQQPNLTAMKTPKPPGAWFATPVQPKRVSDNRASDNVLLSPPKSLRTPIHELKTPRPPGAYIPTPAATTGFVDNAPSDSSIEPEHTFARTTLPTRTPAPPGAYFATPAAAKKSILKVRFDTHGDSTDMSSNVSAEVTQTAPTPSSAGRKAGIRMLDAYGREVVNEDSLEPIPMDNGKARAEEPDITDEAEPIADDTWEHIEQAPVDRLEALARVRQGLSELAQGLEGLDNSGMELDRDRIKELKELSSQAEEARKTASQSIASNGLATNGSLRTRLHTAGSTFSRSYFFWACVVLQLACFLYMYRASVRRAKEMYLTTYLDPFYPNIHLHLPRHGLLPSAEEASLPVADQLRVEGWKASMTHFLDASLVTIRHYQIFAWETYGKEAASDASWPPT